MLDEHAPIHKLSKKELLRKMKPWISKSNQSLIREHNRPFKFYCQEAWDGIKSVVTLKSKAKSYPNSLFVNINITVLQIKLPSLGHLIIFFVNIGWNLASKIIKASDPLNSPQNILLELLLFWLEWKEL